MNILTSVQVPFKLVKTWSNYRSLNTHEEAICSDFAMRLLAKNDINIIRERTGKQICDSGLGFSYLLLATLLYCRDSSRSFTRILNQS